MSNDPKQPAEDAPKSTPPRSASPNVPPADAERIAASEAAAASAGEPELTTPASTGLGSGTGEQGATPEPGAGARDQPVAGNEPATPAGPDPVAGARQVPAAEPVATGADEPASEAPAADEPTTGGRTAAPGAAAGGSAAAEPPGDADPGAPAGDVPPARPVGAVEPGPGAAVPGAAPADSTAAPAAATPAAPAPRPADPGSAAAPGGSGNTRKILIVAAIVVLAAVVVFGVVRLTGGGTPEAGDCVGVTSQTETSAEVEGLDCDADRASYKVGKVVEGSDASCPEEGLYTEVAQGDSGTKLCLLPNMVEGACYQPDEAGTGFVKSKCAGPETIKVTKVVQGSTDLEACPDSAGMSYPEPPVTYCLAPAEE